MNTPMTSWSYSRYSTYKNCPRKAQYLYIDKLKEAPSAALTRGSRVHAEIEEFLTIEDFPVPECAKALTGELIALKKEKPIVEEMWAFDEDWEYCIDVWAANVWLRAKVDACVVKEDLCRIIDFKTGKIRPKNVEQLELYALAAFKKFSLVNTVSTELWYVDEENIDIGDTPSDTKNIQTEVFLRKDLDSLIRKWRGRVRNMLADTAYKPKVSPLCGYCSFAQSKGGPCRI